MKSPIKGIVFKAAMISMLGLTGCAKTLILFKPKPQIDPMPVLSNGPVVDDKADPKYKNQWYLQKIGVTEELLSSADLNGSYKVKIALLSTGVDYNHEDLQRQIAVNEQEITNNEAGKEPGVDREDSDKNGLIDDVVGYDVIDGDGFAFDRHGAGTAVAGIIAANINNGVGISGLMRNVSIYPIRYIDNNGQTSVAALAAALDIAIKSNPDVVFIQNTQIRLGGHEGNKEVVAVELNMLRPYFAALAGKRIPVIVGAGERMSQFAGEGEQVELMLKSFDNVIVVSSTQENDKKSMLSNFSIRDVYAAAPGEKMLSLKPHNQYGEVNGTAYAAAQITAAAGLARAIMGERADANKIRALLASRDSGDAVQDLPVKSESRFNMAKFLRLVRTQ